MTVLSAVGQTSATKTVPYLSNAMFAAHARRGVDVSGLVPKGSAADQDAALADYIREASAVMDSFLLGTLAATLDTEVGPVTVKRSGVAVIVPRFRPVIALTAFAAGPNIAQMTAYTSLAGAAVENDRILLAVGPFGTWNTSAGPLQLGTPAPIPGQLYARWTTCNGYPVTWLTAAASAGATMLSVADTTGIIAGSTQLVLYSGQYRSTFVPTAVSTADASGFGTGPGTITVPALALDVPNDPQYPTYVSALPPDVVMAAVLMTRGLIKKTSGGNLTAAATSGGARSADPLGAGDDMAAAYGLIDQYQMVQR
jgi:hypothetical protein